MTRVTPPSHKRWDLSVVVPVPDLGETSAAGSYPSDEFVELRPRLVGDRPTDTLTGRRSAQRLAVSAGGTIPDRGLYGVFVAVESEGRSVGEFDEEMVYGSRTGDVIARPPGGGSRIGGFATSPPRLC